MHKLEIVLKNRKNNSLALWNYHGLLNQFQKPMSSLRQQRKYVIGVQEGETESKWESRKLTDSFQERKKYTSNEFAIIIRLFRTALNNLEKKEN